MCVEALCPWTEPVVHGLSTAYLRRVDECIRAAGDLGSQGMAGKAWLQWAGQDSLCEPQAQVLGSRS
jgi:hypothetical protein